MYPWGEPRFTMRGPHYDRRNGWEGLIKALDLFCDLRDHPTMPQIHFAFEHLGQHR